MNLDALPRDHFSWSQAKSYHISHGARVDKDGIWHEVVYELGEAIVRFVQLQQTQEWAELRWSS